jgi:glycosyltransferase involved in cell wall biosynthesis
MLTAENCTLVWSFRNRFEVFKESILSAHNNLPKEISFCLVDAASNDETIRQLRALANSIPNRKIRICESAYRTSLSEAWNLGMMLSDTRYVIFASSDVMFLSPVLFSHIAQHYHATKCKYILVENHAVFLLDKKIIPKAGWFDETFVPGPHFDCDYMIKASEAGETVIVISKESNGAELYSHGDTIEESIARTSSEIKDRLPMHDFTNDRVFKEKWQSNWPGWEPYAHAAAKPHPPTHITQVLRLKQEIDPHPYYTKKYV